MDMIRLRLYKMTKLFTPSPWATIVKDASWSRTYSFLPASWAGDAHEETDFLPIGDREEKEGRCLNRRSGGLAAMQVLMAKYWRTKV